MELYDYFDDYGCPKCDGNLDEVGFCDCCEMFFDIYDED